MSGNTFQNKCFIWKFGTHNSLKKDNSSLVKFCIHYLTTYMFILSSVIKHTTFV